MADETNKPASEGAGSATVVSQARPKVTPETVSQIFAESDRAKAAANLGLFMLYQQALLTLGVRDPTMPAIVMVGLHKS